MAENKVKSEETPFNMAMMFYISLNKLIERKDEAYINGDLRGWAKGLRAIKRKIIFKLKKDKKDLGFINDNLGQAEKLLASNFPRQVRTQMQSYVFTDIEKILEEVDEKITFVLDKYQMIFPKIIVKGGLKELEKRYGLSVKN